MITNHFQLYLGESCPRACSESRSHDSSHCLKTVVLQEGNLKTIQKSYKSHVQYSWQREICEEFLLRHSAGDKAAEKQRLQDLRRFFDHHCKGSSAANRLQSRDASHNGASRSYFTSQNLLPKRLRKISVVKFLSIQTKNQ